MLENLKLLRSTAGISQKTLADSIGVSQQSINKYENHNIEPDIATLSSIADYFHVSIDFLVGRTNCQLPPAEDGSAGISSEEESLLCRYRALTPKQKKPSKKSWTAISRYLIFIPRTPWDSLTASSRSHGTCLPDSFPPSSQGRARSWPGLRSRWAGRRDGGRRSGTGP